MHSCSDSLTAYFSLAAILHMDIIRSFAILPLRATNEIPISLPVDLSFLCMLLLIRWSWHCRQCERSHYIYWGSFWIDLFTKQDWNSFLFVFLWKHFLQYCCKNKCLLLVTSILFVLHLVSHQLVHWLVRYFCLKFASLPCTIYIFIHTKFYIEIMVQKAVMFWSRTYCWPFFELELWTWAVNIE